MPELTAGSEGGGGDDGLTVDFSGATSDPTGTRDGTAGFEPTFRIEIDVWELLLDSAPRPVRLILLGFAGLTAASATVIAAGLATLADFLSNPVGFIRLAITDIIIGDIILPAGEAVFNFGLGIIRGILNVFDVFAFQPIRFVTPLVSFLAGIQQLATASVVEFNQALAEPIANTLGIAALPITTALGALWLFAFVWVLYIAYETADLLTGGLLSEVVDVMLALFWPFRRLYAFIFGRST